MCVVQILLRKDIYILYYTKRNRIPKLKVRRVCANPVNTKRTCINNELNITKIINFFFLLFYHERSPPVRLSFYAFKYFEIVAI